MTYDFDSIIDRRDTNSLKWNVGPDELPMWVADMDFTTAPAITETVLAKGLAGVFGYGIVPDTFRASIARWWWARYGWPVEPGWVGFCTGVVPAIASIIRTLVPPGGGVIVQPPVYDSFYPAIADSGRTVVANNLWYDDGDFLIDWPDLEIKLADPKTRALLLCNPHNPTGHIWSSGDLARIGDLAALHRVLVIADEIHCDLTEPGRIYSPFAAVNSTGIPQVITVVSPSKTFNIPGLATAATIIPDETLRQVVAAGLRRDGLTSPNSFAIEATIAAYSQGADWLDELRTQIWRNKRRLVSFIEANAPELKVTVSPATYLVWIDCAALTDNATEFRQFLREKTGLVVNPGHIYGDNAKAFIRMNVACPPRLLEDGLARLARGVAAWKSRA